MYNKLPGKKFTLHENTQSINAKILDVLRAKSHTFISGEQLSHELNMSRTAIWKHVNALRELGYQVEAITSVGYKLTSSPELLLPLEIKNGLHTKMIGQNIHWEYEVSSTNTVALQLADEGAADGTVVVCETQKQGRGRRGRTWISHPENGVYMSVLLRPNFVPMHAHFITFISAIAVAEALQNLYDLPAKIKWPNDVMLKGKKTAGILTELRAETERIHYVVVGLGLNVNNLRFPKNLRDRVTSVALALDEKVSRVKLVQAILEGLERWYFVTLGEQPEQAFQRWQELSCTVGKRVEVNLGDHVVTGQANRLDPNGTLYVTLDSGVEEPILAGDVTMVANV